MKCKCKNCDEEAYEQYIPRTLLGGYCIKSVCLQKGWATKGYIYDPKLPDVRTKKEKNLLLTYF